MPTSPSRLSILAACVFAFGLLLSGFLEVRPVDDAYIGIRYAHNLASGAGAVFNVGERVEGYSDPLWIAILAIAHHFAWPLDRWAVTLGLLSSCAAMAFAFLTCVRLGAHSLPALIGVFLVACAPPYWMAGTNGLETGLFALAVTATYSLIVARRPFPAGIVGAVAITIRPEGIMLLPLAALASILLHRTDPDLPVRPQALWSMLAPCVVTLAAMLLARQLYYHEWIPNSVTAKKNPANSWGEVISSLILGQKYVSSFVGDFGLLLALAAISFFDRSFRAASLLAATWLLAQAGVAILNSGDWMPHYRLFTPLLPLVAIQAGLALHLLRRRLPSSQWRAAAITVLALSALAAFGSRDWTRRFHMPMLRPDYHKTDPLISTYEEIATALRPVLTSEDIISPEALGLISCVLPDVRFHDFCGLTDRHVAHHGTVFHPTYGKSDYSYTIRHVRPTLIIVHSREWHISSMEAFSSGEMSRDYRLFQHGISERFWLAVRLDRLDSIVSALKTAGVPIESIPFPPSAHLVSR